MIITHEHKTYSKHNGSMSLLGCYKSAKQQRLVKSLDVQFMELAGNITRSLARSEQQRNDRRSKR